MAKPRQSLTQGLSASIAQKFIADPDSVQSPQTVSIKSIQLPGKQPRRYFDPEKQEQLVKSVKEHGILEPVLVRPNSKGNYELVAGERRYRAAQEVGLKEIPVVIRDFDDRQALQVALMENLQREDLNPVEETEGILELLAIALDTTSDEVVSLLHQAYNAKQRGRELNDNVTIQLKKAEEVLATVGRFNAESFRSNRLPLLNLPPDILQALRQGKLEYTKARVIARLKDEAQRKNLLQDAVKNGLSLNQIKERVKEGSPSSSSDPTTSDRLVAVSRKVKQGLDDPKKQQRLEKLLQELERLVED